MKPILFSTPMIQALLAGKKSQTRRVVKDDCTGITEFLPADPSGFWGFGADGPVRCIHSPYGDVGDYLWVRESWWQRGGITTDMDGERSFIKNIGQDKVNVAYRADFEYAPHGEYMYDTWRPMPSIFMPRWASRITLEITDVRVERVQDISEADACAEGVTGCRDHLPNVHAVEMYHALWDSINEKKAPWASNPWTWAITFRVVNEVPR